jgi:putative copper export protein/mono/diheme cytochrome c family protein
MISPATTLALARGLHLAATLSLLGTVGFIAWVLPAAAADGGGMASRLIRLWRVSGGLALSIGVVWLVLQTAAIAGTADLGRIAAAMPVVAAHTRYGHVVLIRLGLVLVATLLAGGSRFRLYTALVLIAVAVGLQGLIGHAGAMGGGSGAALVAFESLHLLAAGLWLGALTPLWLCLGRLPAGAAADVCERFSPIGLGCVLVIAGTGLAQGTELIVSLPGLVGTHYGRIALLKIALFLAAVAFAAVNRLWLTDRLSRAATTARKWLRLSVSGETLIGLAIILTAAFLASSMPATHETPIWPFSWRPSLDVLSDPYGRRQLLSILLPSAIVGALVIAGSIWRQAFWLSLVAFAVTLALVGPKLVLLLTIDAYPTTFFTSPTEFAESSIVRGAALFAAKCAICHGVEAQGDGPIAKSLPVPPADLTAPHFWMHTEGDLFWYISHGMPSPDGTVAMPAFDKEISSGDRWALIDFLRAHNAGRSVAITGRWNMPTPAPQFDAVCANGSPVNLDDLRGRVLRFIANSEDLPSPPSVPDGRDVTTILLSPGRKIRPVGTACVATDPAVWNAFSILLGVGPEAMAGTQVLTDQSGWLRVRWRPGDPGDWNDPQDLARVISDILAHPLAVRAGAGYAHHH